LRTQVDGLFERSSEDPSSCCPHVRQRHLKSAFDGVTVTKEYTDKRLAKQSI
jgi:hypothetical protein